MLHWGSSKAESSSPHPLSPSSILVELGAKQIVSSLLGIKITSSEKGKLRKRLDPGNSKLITFSDFISFFGEDAQTDSNTEMSSSQLPSLPLDVPQLPDA